MGLEASGIGAASALAPTPEQAVRVVAHRHVQEHREDAEDHALHDVLLSHPDEDRKDGGGKRGAVQRAAPGGLLVEAVVAALLRGRLPGRGGAVRADLAARATGGLDRARLRAAVLTPALLPGLGHRRLRSLTRPRWCGSRSRRGPRAPLAARGRRA